MIMLIIEILGFSIALCFYCRYRKGDSYDDSYYRPEDQAIDNVELQDRALLKHSSSSSSDKEKKDPEAAFIKGNQLQEGLLHQTNQQNFQY